MIYINKKAAILVALGLLLPVISNAQDIAGEIKGFSLVLDSLYEDMLPLCDSLITFGRSIAGFAALWYIAVRVYRQLANAEPLDMFPLLRPFAIGLAILLFPQVIALLNGVLKPTVTGTSAMVAASNKSIEVLLAKKAEAVKTSFMWHLFGEMGTGGQTYHYLNPETGEEEDTWDMISTGVDFAMNAPYYILKNSIKFIVSEILQILYETASLCLNTIRTFYLLVLAILGPLVFGLAVFDGFQNGLTIWLARYINVFLWLPIANIFGAIINKVQENMLLIDIAQLEKYGKTFFTSADTGYIIFLLIGIIGYFTVPSVANYVVNAAGGHVLLSKTTAFISGTTVGAGKAAAAMYTGGGSAAAGSTSSASSGATSAGGAGASSGSGNNSSFQNDRLSGKSS